MYPQRASTMSTIGRHFILWYSTTRVYLNIRYAYDTRMMEDVFYSALQIRISHTRYHNSRIKFRYRYTVHTRANAREFEQENEVGRRRRGWQFLPVLHIILRILSLGSGVKAD